MPDSLAPIILFVYNRPDHTRRTINALKNNILADQSELFVFSDGIKKNADTEKVKEVREYIKQITGFRRVVVIERERNYGLAKSVVEGVTEIIERYGKVIVLEDDLITHKYFLTYMNNGLDMYEDNPKVYSVSGYSYLRKNIIGKNTYFLKITSSWSWATWLDKWKQYDTNCTGWEKLKKDYKLRKRFDYDFSYFFYKLINLQLKHKKIDSWAIKWYWTVFKNDGLTLYPQTSLVNNSGFDGSGVHCGSKQRNTQKPIEELVTEYIDYETEVMERVCFRKQVVKDLRKGLGLGGKLQIIADMFG